MTLCSVILVDNAAMKNSEILVDFLEPKRCTVRLIFHNKVTLFDLGAAIIRKILVEKEEQGDNIGT